MVGKMNSSSSTKDISEPPKFSSSNISVTAATQQSTSPKLPNSTDTGPVSIFAYAERVASVEITVHFANPYPELTEAESTLFKSQYHLDGATFTTADISAFYMQAPCSSSVTDHRGPTSGRASTN